MVQTDSDLLKGKFSSLEDTVDLSHKTQSMTVDAEILFAKICAIECIYWTLLKGYDRLTDKMSLQEGNMHAIKIMSKNETLSLLYRLHTLESLMRAVEQNTGKKIQMLQKVVINRFEKIEEINKFYDEEQKVKRQNLTLSVCKKL